MNRTRPRVIAVALLLTLLTGCGSGLERYGGFTFVSPGGQSELTYPAAERGTIGDLSGPDLTSDGTIQLSDYAGKVVVINVWGSWCGPCRGEADSLNLAATLTADKGVQFLGINVRDTREAGADFHRQQEGAVPVDLRPVDADPAVDPGLPDQFDSVDDHPGPRSTGWPTSSCASSTPVNWSPSRPRCPRRPATSPRRQTGGL